MILENGINNNSMVLRIDFKNNSFLFTGDIEKTMEEEKKPKKKIGLIISVVLVLIIIIAIIIAIVWYTNSTKAVSSDPNEAKVYG